MAPRSRVDFLGGIHEELSEAGQFGQWECDADARVFISDRA
jgi:hypothetical protein